VQNIGKKSHFAEPCFEKLLRKDGVSPKRT